MTEKWLGPNESVIMDAKSFVWSRSSLKLNGTWAHIYLTNERLYVKDRLFGFKLLDFQYEDIISVEFDEKHLVVIGDYKGDRYRLKIDRKNLDEMWGFMIKRRMEV